MKNLFLLILIFNTTIATSQWNTWTKHSNNPIYEHATEGAWDVASDPAVIKDGKTYRMIVSGDRGVNVVGSGDGNSILMATSDDGYSWTTLDNGQNGVVLMGVDEEWDESMELPELIKIGDEYKIFYCGYDPEVRDSTDGMVWGELGLATSSDGENFIKLNLPVMERTPDWYDQDGITDPTIVAQNDTLFMIYLGWCTQDCGMNGGEPAFYSLKAISTDYGITWEKQGLLTPNATTYQHADIELNPDGSYSLFYNMDFDCTDNAIGIRQAIGTTPFGPFEDVADNPIFCLGTQTFETSGLDGGFPTVINDNGTAKLYYTGIDETNWFYKIGLVESNQFVSVLELDSKDSEVIIYPNPANNHVTIQNTSLSLDQIRVYNSFGQDLTSKTSFKHNKNQSIEINITGFESGIYLIQAGLKMYRLVVE